MFVRATVFLFNSILPTLILSSLIDFDSEAGLRRSFLDHLGLDEIPQFSKGEFESFQVPAQAKLEYDVLVQKQKTASEKKFPMRSRRSSGPSLANLFNKAHNNQHIQGTFVHSSTFREKLRFDMEGRIPERSRITIAELRLFKKLPNVNRRMHNSHRAHVSLSTNQHSSTTSWRSSPVHHARVSVFHTLTHPGGVKESKLIDSRLIMVNGSGWQSFDVTRAVQQWQKHPVKFMSITLELRVDGSRPGHVAAEIARMVRFTGQQASLKSPRRPELVIFTEDEENLKTNDCRATKNNHPRQKCCRAKQFVNFREMSWTSNWIIEPTGYDAFRCAGRCRPSRQKSSPGASRSCTVVETAPLAVMYLVKQNGETRVQVTEFPNMIVEKCGCSLDSLYMV